MSSKISSLLEKKKWSGVFFTEEKGLDTKFSGEIDYSPEKGVILNYLMLERLEKDEEFQLLYGILSTGKFVLSLVFIIIEYLTFLKFEICFHRILAQLTFQCCL